MKKTKEIYAGGFYLFIGRSSANSTFIRNKSEAKIFLETANKRFQNYLTIRDYYLTQDSWTLLCEISKEETIVDTYMKARSQSDRVRPECTLSEVWRIVSEQYRHFLSWFVKFSNFKSGRTGSLVHSSFERFYFESLEEAQDYIASMRNQRHSNGQRKKEFRPYVKEWENSGSENCGAIELCTKKFETGEVSGCFWKGCIKLVDFTNDVLRNLIIRTTTQHNTHIFTKKTHLII